MSTHVAKKYLRISLTHSASCLGEQTTHHREERLEGPPATNCTALQLDGHVLLLSLGIMRPWTNCISRTLSF
jgi:hypothetical protein